EPSATLAALRERAHLHHLACRSDRDIAIRAVVGSRDDLTLRERTNLAEAGDGGTGREHGPTGVEHHPDLTLGRGDGRLVDEPKQPAIVAARLGWGALRRGHDLGGHGEVQAAILSQR